jgi:hypothetical protein
VAPAWQATWIHAVTVVLMTVWEKAVGARLVDAMARPVRVLRNYKISFGNGLVKGVFVLISNTTLVKYEHAFRCRLRASAQP